MKKMSTYLIAVVAAILFGISNVSAAERDDGTDHNGKFILSETLARRCGLSSQAPDITEDCIRRLAYDKETDIPVGFFNFNDEQQSIIGDYVSAYMEQAVNGMINGGEYADRIDGLIGRDPTASISLDNDSREDMEFHNKIMNDNADVFSAAVNYRASQINMDNIISVLEMLVPETEVDVNDTSLALAP